MEDCNTSIYRIKQWVLHNSNKLLIALQLNKYYLYFLNRSSWRWNTLDCRSLVRPDQNELCHIRLNEVDNHSSSLQQPSNLSVPHYCFGPRYTFRNHHFQIYHIIFHQNPSFDLGSHWRHQSSIVIRHTWDHQTFQGQVERIEEHRDTFFHHSKVKVQKNRSYHRCSPRSGSF